MNQPCVSRSYIFRLVAGFGFITLALTLTDAAADTVFKCKGVDGAMHYQGAKCAQTDEVTKWETKSFKSVPMIEYKPSPIIARMGSHGGYMVEGEVNGTSANMLVDTGAAAVSIPAQLAEKLHLERGQPIQMSTANGIITGYRTVVRSLKVGKFSLRDIEAVVMPNMSDVLLGQTALSHLKVEQSKGELRLSAL